eukprot:5288641-Amphidinium_carterae.1
MMNCAFQEAMRGKARSPSTRSTARMCSRRRLCKTCPLTSLELTRQAYASLHEADVESPHTLQGLVSRGARGPYDGKEGRLRELQTASSAVGLHCISSDAANQFPKHVYILAPTAPGGGCSVTLSHSV